MKTLIPMLALLLALAAAPAQAKVDELPEPQRIAVVGPMGKTPSLEQVRHAVATAGAPRGWQMVDEQPGRITLRNVVRGKHTVVVAVDYDAAGFRIDYVSSENMNYREKRGRRYIHPKYMQWTGLLAQDIGARLQAP